MDADAYLRNLPPLGRIVPLDISAGLDKAAVVAAEVRLPLAPGVDVSSLRWVRMRPLYEPDTRVLLVDASRLSAP